MSYCEMTSGVELQYVSYLVVRVCHMLTLWKMDGILPHFHWRAGHLAWSAVGECAYG